MTVIIADIASVFENIDYSLLLVFENRLILFYYRYLMT